MIISPCRDDEWYMARSIASMRELILTKPERIILGDSRMANLNTEYIEQVSGERYTNMAYGGATLEESLEQLEYALGHTHLSKVVIGVDYYTLNRNYANSDRMPEVIAKSENPIRFIADFGYWIDAAQNAKNMAFDLLADWTGDDELRPVLDDPSSLAQKDPPLTSEMEDGYRKDLLQYAHTLLGNMTGDTGYGLDFAFSDQNGYLQKLIDLAGICKERGIELIIVITPCNRAVWDVVIYPNGIDIAMTLYKDMLKRVATVYDGEFYNDFAKDDTRFLDGHHLVLEEKMRMARILFGGEPSPFWLRTTPKEYVDGAFELTDQMQITP